MEKTIEERVREYDRIRKGVAEMRPEIVQPLYEAVLYLHKKVLPDCDCEHTDKIVRMTKRVLQHTEEAYRKTFGDNKEKMFIYSYIVGQKIVNG